MRDITQGRVKEPTRAEAILAFGLRDEKRRRTRRHIAEVATGLFLERGFAQVTIAEVARTAEVSVNSVYTYFPSKEDLVCYPEEVSAERMVQMVRDRPAGQSAAGAVLEALRRELHSGDRTVGLTQGFGRFLEMVRAEPALAARLDEVERSMVDALAATLAAETASGTASGAAPRADTGTGAPKGRCAGPQDLMARLVASQLGWVQEQLFRGIGELSRSELPPAAVTEAALELLDTLASLLGDRVLTFATR